MRVPSRLGALLLLVLGAVGCDAGSPGPTPVAIAIVGGSGQAATVGAAVGPIQIEIRDAEGVPIGGLAFTAVVSSGGGSLASSSGRTEKGPSPVGTWTLGTTAGTQTLTISSGSLPPVTVTATARAAAAAVAEVPAGSTTSVAGSAAAVASVQPSVRVRDAFGNAVVGTAVTVTVTGGGRVQNPAPVTDATGVASVGVWTLGGRAGAQTVVLSAPGVPPVTYTATVEPGPPAVVVPSGAPSGPVTVGSVLTGLTLALEDAFENRLAGRPLSVVVSAGGGSLAGSGVVTTDANGQVTLGAWTLGTLPGTNTLLVSFVGGVSDLSVQTVVGPPTTLAAVAGAGQQAFVNTALPVAPVFELSDAFGNPIVGASVVFSITSGGGSLAELAATTDATGRASPGTWTLGATVGTQAMRATSSGLEATITATAAAAVGGGGGGGGASAYAIDVRYVGAAPSTAVQAAFTAAAARISQIITGDLPSRTVTNFNYATSCDLPGAPTLTEVIDDLLIFVVVGPIDGPGGVLGQAGPCLLRGGSLLPFIGDMIFDEADLAALQASGGLGDVILHEMLHVIGIGTIWGDGLLALLNGQGGVNPFFTGASARVAYLAAGGNAALSGVPVENTGGAGTRDGHWRENIFGRELMTGFYNSGVVNPLSAITAGALGDLGYSVDLGAADVYTVSAALRAGSVQAGTVLPHADTRLPRYVLDADGGVRALRPTGGGAGR